MPGILLRLGDVLAGQRVNLGDEGLSGAVGVDLAINPQSFTRSRNHVRRLLSADCLVVALATEEQFGAIRDYLPYCPIALPNGGDLCGVGVRDWERGVVATFRALDAQVLPAHVAKGQRQRFTDPCSEVQAGQHDQPVAGMQVGQDGLDFFGGDDAAALHGGTPVWG